MTKHETIITIIKCDLCENPNIEWRDENDLHHLCKQCYYSKTGK